MKNARVGLAVWVSCGVLGLMAVAFGIRPGCANAAWQDIVVAAEKEGKIAIYGQGGANYRKGLLDGFRKKYPGIQVEYTGAPGSKIPPKILTQRKGGKYLVDLVTSGPTSIFTALKPAGALDPIQPFLSGPDVQDLSKWMGGGFEFVDNEKKYLFLQHTYVAVPFIYNPKLVSSGEIRSWWDLLDAKWKGKMVMFDPLVPGPGIGKIGRWMLSQDLGKDFMRKLFTQQEVVFSRNRRQVSDWVARGRYAIALAFATGVTSRMIAKGVEIRMTDPYSLKEGPATSTGATGVVSVINRAPHPDAVKVYLNHLLSQQGQYELSKAVDTPSRRLDVPTDHLPDTVHPVKSGMKILDAHTEASIHVRVEAKNFVKSILGK